jgi:hypothetical protein
MRLTFFELALKVHQVEYGQSRETDQPSWQLSAATEGKVSAPKMRPDVKP